MKTFSLALFLTALVAGVSAEDNNNPNWSFLSFNGGRKPKTEPIPSTLDTVKPRLISDSKASNLKVETNPSDSTKPSNLKGEIGQPIPEANKPNDAVTSKPNEANLIKSNDQTGNKPNEASLTKPNEASLTKPKEADLTKPKEADLTKPSDQSGNKPNEMIPEVIQPISNPTSGLKENSIKETPTTPDTKKNTAQEDRKEGFFGGGGRKIDHRKPGHGNRRHRDRDDYYSDEEDEEEDYRHRRNDHRHGHRGGKHLTQETKSDDRSQQSVKQDPKRNLIGNSGKAKPGPKPPSPPQEEDDDSDDEVRTFDNDDDCENDDEEEDRRRPGHRVRHSVSCRRRQRRNRSRFD